MALREVDEGGVAGLLEGGAQGHLVGAAGGTAVVLQGGGAVGQGDLRGAGDHGVGVVAVGQGGGGGDELEGRARGLRLLGGAVEQRGVLVVLQGLEGGVRGLGVTGGDGLRIVGGGGRHAEDLAGRRTQCDDGTGVAGVRQLVVGGLLHGRVEGQLDVRAALLLAGEGVPHLAGQQRVIGAVEDGVLRLLDAGGAVAVGEVADDRAVGGGGGRVGALVVTVLVRGGLGQDLTAGGDLTAGDGLGLEVLAGVAGVVGVGVRLEALDPGQVDQEDRYQHEDEDGDVPDCAVHWGTSARLSLVVSAAASFARVRVSCEIFSRIASNR